MIFDTKQHPVTQSILVKASRELSEADERLGGLIQKVGPCQLSLTWKDQHFPSLVEAILYQQLSTKAAGTILNRFRSLYATKRFPTAKEIHETPESDLRSVGISRQKISYLKDLSKRMMDRSLLLTRIDSMNDVEVIAHLCQVKGIGRWTSEMFLIFTLGRPDVMPTTDLGIQKAVQRLYRMRTVPFPDKVEKLGQRWRPYRSVAAWYLWASVDGNF